MRLDPLETHTAVWRPVPDDDLVDVVLTGAAARSETDPAGARPAEAATTSRLVLVDGRGGSGKSTFAARFAARSGATVQVVMNGGQGVEGRLVSASEAGVVVQQPQASVYIRAEAVLMVIVQPAY